MFHSYYCTLEFFNLCHQFRNDVLLRNLSKNSPLPEQHCTSVAAGDSDVCLSCLAGSVYYTAHDCNLDIQVRELRCKVGLVLQHAEDQLFCPTVLEDVAFGPLNLGCTQDEARDRAASTLERLGLAGFENRLTHRLSGGEKKLVSLATVLVMEPEALLLDEPTNGLDPEARQRIIGVLKTLPTARIIISHDWDFLAETSSEYLTVEGQHFTDAAPSHAHAHMHVHPLGNKPHEH